MVNHVIFPQDAPAESFDSGYGTPENHSKQNPAWERIATVIRYSGEKSANSLAENLGLRRAEGLYQIKRGNYGISKKLAKKINARFPQFGVSWLVFGEQDNKPANVADGSPSHNNPDGFTKKKITLDIIPELTLPAIRLLQIQLACIRENHEITALYNKQNTIYPHLDEMCRFLEEVRANIYI